jgi:hypothetical protein
MQQGSATNFSEMDRNFNASLMEIAIFSPEQTQYEKINLD